MQKNPSKIHLSVTLDATYTANGATPEQLKSLIDRFLRDAIEQHGLGRTTGATVDQFTIRSCALDSDEANLTQDKLGKWFSAQIISGDMPLKDLGQKMAHYALSSPADVRQEFAAVQANNKTRRYLTEMDWSHIFEGTHPETVRWVIDKELQCLIAAQVLRGSKWRSLTRDEAADLAESLMHNDLLEDGCGGFSPDHIDILPKWASDRMKINMAHDAHYKIIDGPVG